MQCILVGIAFWRHNSNNNGHVRRAETQILIYYAKLNLRPTWHTLMKLMIIFPTL
jgi:hypothetical protein